MLEHDDAPDPPPEDIALVPLFDDPVRLLLPADHPRAGEREVAPADLAQDTWIRAHDGAAARLVDRVLREAGIDPPLLLAGRGEEPIEAQPLIAAGTGVTAAHDLNVLLDGPRIAVRPLAGPAPQRRVQAATVRGDDTPMTRAALDALRQAGAERVRPLRTRACR